MATSGDAAVRSDHVIIWLDKNMGVKGNNESSKAILNNNANLDQPPADEASSDIDRLICKMDLVLNKQKYHHLIKSPLRIFADEDECIKCIYDSIGAKKKPFLIASGEMGALIVPKIHTILSGYIYIFCGQRVLHEKWTGPYENDIVIYDDEKGVFARVLADIGIHYYQKGQNETSNQTGAIQYLNWARQLFNSARRLDHIDRQVYLDYVSEELNERNASPSDGNDSDTPVAQVTNEG